MDNVTREKIPPYLVQHIDTNTHVYWLLEYALLAGLPQKCQNSKTLLRATTFSNLY